MTASFALLQQTLEVPPVEKLKSAFRAGRCLTPADAHTVANDAYGILVKNLSPDDAVALQGALRAEGIETHMVLQSDLPQLPPIKFLRRVDFQPDALVIYDPIGRTIPVQWGHVMLIAAGSVRVIEFAHEKKASSQTHWDYDGLGKFLQADFFLRPKKPTTDLAALPESFTREKLSLRLLLEIVLSRATMRFQVQADRFLFTCLDDRATSDVTTNFTLLVQEIMTFAPRALVNRGAFHLRENTAEVVAYPSKNAFYEEMMWILWRAQESPGP